jgi:hypothetical protein
MKCSECGARCSPGLQFCAECGAPTGASHPAAAQVTRAAAGFSPRISDPAFEAYIKKSRKYTAIFGISLAVVAFVGYVIYGVSENDLSTGLLGGTVLGVIFLALTFFTIVRTKAGGTSDGTVVDKKIEKRTKSNNKTRKTQYYSEFVLTIKQDNGKIHKRSSNTADDIYDYYRVGDRVRRHPGLHHYEKYDKSGDAEILCNACMKFNPVNADVCSRCKCPVLN